MEHEPDFLIPGAVKDFLRDFYGVVKHGHEYGASAQRRSSARQAIMSVEMVPARV
jgi:hypothetical protein